MKFFKNCRIKCRCCGDVLEYENRSRLDRGPGAPMICSCGKIGLDPSAMNYRVLAFPPGTLEDIEDLSEEWIEREHPYSVGPGWWSMLDEQLEAARKIVPDVTHEEKEKYGRCDIYFWSEELFGSSTELFAIEDKVEKLSLQICEFCGQPGRLREDRAWMQTLCDRCAALDPLERRKVAEEVEEKYFRMKAAKDLFGVLPPDAQLLRSVEGNMALSGFTLTEEDKERIRAAASMSHEEIEAEIQRLIEKHKKEK